MPGRPYCVLLLICAAALGLLLAGCRAQPAALSPAVPTASAAPGLNAAETLPPPAVRTATNTPAPSLTPTPQNTATPSPSPTVDRYAGLRIPYLAAREYGGGEIEVVQTLAENSYFTRLLIRYPSDGLTIYGFMNVPVRGERSEERRVGKEGRCGGCGEQEEREGG